MTQPPSAMVTLRRGQEEPRVVPLEQIPRKKQVGDEIWLPGDPRPWRIFKIDFPPGWKAA